MKKISVFLCLFMILGNLTSVFGAEGVIKNGRTLVPVRGVFESLGFSVNWDSTANKASISDGSHEVSVIKGLNYFKIDGRQIYPDVPQQIINGRLYLPLWAICNAIGADSSWDKVNKVAHIIYNGKDVYVKCKAVENDTCYLVVSTRNCHWKRIGDYDFECYAYCEKHPNYEGHYWVFEGIIYSGVPQAETHPKHYFWCYGCNDGVYSELDLKLGPKTVMLEEN